MIRRALLLGLLLCLLAPAAARAGEPDPLAPAYAADLTGSDGGFRWAGRLTFSLANPDPAPLARVWLRLWGNGRDGCRRLAVRIRGVTGAAAGATTRRCTALPLDLAVPIAPGARAEIGVDVDIRLPLGSDRFGRGGQELGLFSNALPALAHREGGRWRLDRYFGGGEAWTYPAADWRVRLAPPPGVQVAAPGVLQPDGTRLLERARDYSWAAGRMRRLAGTVDGVAVTVWSPRDVPSAVLGRTLAAVRRRLPSLARLFGPYGWPDLQVVITEAAAMEHTALIMTPPRDLVITHELAHEWWYALFGNDQTTAPWLDEGFATWAEEAARGRRLQCPRSPLLGRLSTRGVDAFRGDRYQLYGAVYLGGGCLLQRIEARIGRRAFRAALRAYSLERRYGWHTAETFKAAMDAAAAPRRLDDLWREFRLN